MLIENVSSFARSLCHSWATCFICSWSICYKSAYDDDDDDDVDNMCLSVGWPKSWNAVDCHGITDMRPASQAKAIWDT